MIVLLRFADVARACGLGRSTIYRDIANGVFPQPVKIRTNALWPSDEVEAVLAARTAGHPEEAVRELVARLRARRGQGAVTA